MWTEVFEAARRRFIWLIAIVAAFEVLTDAVVAALRSEWVEFGVRLCACVVLATASVVVERLKSPGIAS